MSCTTLMIVRKSGRVDPDVELRNSHGSAPRIWDAMFSNYFRLSPEKYPGEHRWACWLNLRGDDEQRFWLLWKDDSIPTFARRVFALTFDKVTVAKRDFDTVADDLDLFSASFLASKPEYVNHLPAIAAWLRSLKEKEMVGRAAFHWTSVDGDSWSGREDKRGRYRRYNTRTDGERRFEEMFPPEPVRGAP